MKKLRVENIMALKYWIVCFYIPTDCKKKNINPPWAGRDFCKNKFWFPSVVYGLSKFYTWETLGMIWLLTQRGEHLWRPSIFFFPFSVNLYWRDREHGIFQMFGPFSTFIHPDILAIMRNCGQRIIGLLLFKEVATGENI